MTQRLPILLLAVFVSSAAAHAGQDAFEEQLIRAGYGVEQRTCVINELSKGGEAVDYALLAEGLHEQLDLAEAQGAPVDDAAREEILIGLAEALPMFAAFKSGPGDPEAMARLSSVSSALLSNCLTLQK